MIGEHPHNELRLLYCEDDEIGDEVDECQNKSLLSLLHKLPFPVCIDDDVELGLFERFQRDLSPQMELVLLLPLNTLDSPLVNDK